MIRLPSWLASKNSKRDPVTLAGLDEARYIDAFHAGYLLAMTHGVPKLEETLLDRAAMQVLSGLSETIEHRAMAAGIVNPRPVLDLQTKLQEFAMKQSSAKTPEDRVKYQHYIEALQWALPSNGH